MLKKFLGFIIFLLFCFLIYNAVLSFYPKKKFFTRENEINAFSEEKIDQEIFKLEEHLNIEPNDMPKNVELRIYYFLKGPKFYDKAINILDNAWRMGALDERIFYYLANMYEFLKLYNFAILEYKKYLNNVKVDIESELHLANLYYITSNLDDAIMTYENILKKDTDNIIAMMNLSTIFFEKQNYSDARDYLIKVKELCKKNNIIEPKNVNFYLGKIHFMNKNYDAAIDFFKKELSLYKENNLDVKIFLVKSFYEIKDFSNALLYAKEVLNVTPDNKEIKLLISKIKK